MKHNAQRWLCWLLGVCALPWSAAAVTPMLAAGSEHAAALLANGTVYTWGSDNSGQLGLGRVTLQSTPQRVPGVVLGAAAPGRLAAGASHSAAVDGSGQLWAWGENLLGQLGDGSRVTRAAPVRVGAVGSALAVAVGDSHTLALKSDGTVWGWGNNQWGQIGDGMWGFSYTQAVPSSRLNAAQAIAAGSRHSLALQQGRVWAWGDDSFGQLGHGQIGPLPTLLESLNDVVGIAAGANHSVALDAQGRVWAWGDNREGQLGDGSTSNRSAPVPVSGLPAIRSLAAGASHTLALAQDGSVWVWGGNADGQLGLGHQTRQLQPVRLPALAGISVIAAGASHSLALQSGVGLWAWGGNASGALGDASTSTRLRPVLVPDTTDWQTLAAGFGYSLAAAADGRLWAWGDNTIGQLGTAAATDRSYPGKVVGLEAVSRVAAGFRHTLAVRSNGEVWAWGYNQYGQLGDGSSRSRSAPVLLPDLTDALDVAAGFRHSLALSRDGSVWAWGANENGELGSGNTLGPLLRPARIAGLADVRQIAAGYDHSLALTGDGAVWAWGSNDSGQLGVGAGVLTEGWWSSKPLRVTGLPGKAVALAAGLWFSLVVLDNGQVWGWGNNNDLQLHDRSETPLLNLRPNRRGAARLSFYNDFEALPVRIAGIDAAVGVAAGAASSYAVKADGSVWAWGGNLDGQLGNGSTQPGRSPAPVAGLSGVVAVASGASIGLVWGGTPASFALARKRDASVWAWGYNQSAALGDGTYLNRLQPVATLNDDFSGYCDLDWALAKDPLPAAQQVPFFVAAQKSGSQQMTTLDVDLRGLAAVAAAASTRAAARYNVYVAAAAGVSAWFELHPDRSWAALTWPMSEYLSGVALDNSTSVVRTQILEAVDLSGLGGVSVYLGYGLDADEMLRAGRVRAIFTVPLP